MIGGTSIQEVGEIARNIAGYVVEEALSKGFKEAFDYLNSNEDEFDVDVNSLVSLLSVMVRKHLKAPERAKLKLAIRKRRERKPSQDKTITISAKAFELIRKLANRDDVTYSEATEKYFGRAWRPYNNTEDSDNLRMSSLQAGHRRIDRKLDYHLV